MLLIPHLFFLFSTLSSSPYSQMATTKTGRKDTLRTSIELTETGRSLSEQLMIGYQLDLSDRLDLLVPQPEPTTDGSTAAQFTNNEMLSFIQSHPDHPFCLLAPDPDPEDEGDLCMLHSVFIHGNSLYAFGATDSFEERTLHRFPIDSLTQPMDGLLNWDSPFSGSNSLLKIPTAADLLFYKIENFFATEFAKIPAKTARSTQRPAKLILIDPWLYAFFAASVTVTTTDFGYAMKAEDLCRALKKDNYMTMANRCASLVYYLLANIRGLNEGKSGLVGDIPTYETMSIALQFKTNYNAFQQRQLTTIGRAIRTP